MKEEYFEEVISKISELCCEIREKECSHENSNELKAESLILDAAEIKALKERASYREELKKYLYNLSDKTLSVICALMDFGRNHSGKVLPINLNKFFNKYYLPYWFDKNKSEDKGITVDYLVSKEPLAKYLNRAEFILFYSKNDNIDLKDECGGYLCLQESDGIERIEYDEYELRLKCLNCGAEISKYVDKDFLDKSI
ncbi:hypothetical protein TPELB_24450 [Terrisporobacter petrolearius]|uniref:Uncharacterized protein n=1 Tax=Terrisporobacter petrolearius TaxID=1460447 RepID=A0ABZ3FE88_9FIRM